MMNCYWKNTIYIKKKVITKFIKSRLKKSKVVFDVKKKQGTKEFIIFIILSVIGLGINSLIMYLMVDIFKIYYMISKLVSTFIVMVYNFITRKIFIEK